MLRRENEERGREKDLAAVDDVAQERGRRKEVRVCFPIELKKARDTERMGKRALLLD